MTTGHSKEFLSWFNEWASRYALSKTTRQKLLKESEDIDGILFLAAVACSSDEVSKFTSNEREKLALQRALASLNTDDNAIVKTSTKPFGVKACDRHGASSSDSDQRNASCVPRLNISQAARDSNGDEKRDWSCGLCRFIRVKFSDINPTIQSKKTDSFYDCFECNRSFCLQSELTTHICQVH